MKLNMTDIFRTVKNKAVEHGPEILTGVGIAGMITTTILAVKATPKALEMIEDKKQEEHTDELTPVEIIKTAWKPYIPAIVTGVCSTVCLVGASSVHVKRNAALMTAYQISASTLKEWKESVKETVDEETKKVIDDKVAEKRIKHNPPTKKQRKQLERAEKMESRSEIPLRPQFLCYDAGGNHYFRSDEISIREAIVKLNERMNDNFEAYVCLNDLYELVGAKCTDVGDKLGWNRYREGSIEPIFSSQMSDTGEPTIVLSYSVAPDYDYHKIDYR